MKYDPRQPQIDKILNAIQNNIVIQFTDVRLHSQLFL